MNEYNFADIPDSKKRTEVIQEFIEIMKLEITQYRNK